MIGQPGSCAHSIQGGGALTKVRKRDAEETKAWCGEPADNSAMKTKAGESNKNEGMLNNAISSKEDTKTINEMCSLVLAITTNKSHW